MSKMYVYPNGNMTSGVENLGAFRNLKNKSNADDNCYTCFF
jgi:hypothetical protein